MWYEQMQFRIPIDSSHFGFPRCWYRRSQCSWLSLYTPLARFLPPISIPLEWMGYFSIISAFFFLPTSTALTNVFVALAVIFCVITPSFREQIQKVLSLRIVWVALLLLFMIFLGIFYSVASLKEAARIGFKYNKLLVLLFVMPLLLKERIRMFAIHGYLVGIGIVTLLIFLKQVHLVHMDTGNGDCSLFKSYLQISACAAVALLLSAHLCFEVKTHRWFYILIGLLSLCFVFFISPSRTGYVIGSAIIFAFFWQRFSWKGVMMGCFGILFIWSFFYLLSPEFQDRTESVIYDLQLKWTKSFSPINPASYSDKKPLTSIPSNLKVSTQALIDRAHGYRDTSFQERRTFWKGALLLASKRPFFGYGMGSFETLYNQTSYGREVPSSNPHNEYLNITVQIGVCGLLILLYLWVVQWQNSYLMPRFYRFITQNLLMVMMLGCLMNSWLMDTTEGHLYLLFTTLTSAVLLDKSSQLKRDKRNP